MAFLLSACPDKSGKPAPAPTVVIHVAGTDCPIDKIVLTSLSANVTTTSGTTILDVSVTVNCKTDDTLEPLKGVTLTVSISGFPFPQNSMGPTNDQGTASKTFGPPATPDQLNGKTANIQVQGDDGKPHDAGQVTVTKT